MEDNMIATVMVELGISKDSAQKNMKALSEINAYYFWDSNRGGKSIIINKYGEKLIAPSSIPLYKHIQAFIEGKRN